MHMEVFQVDSSDALSPKSVPYRAKYEPAHMSPASFPCPSIFLPTGIVEASLFILQVSKPYTRIQYRYMGVFLAARALFFINGNGNDVKVMANSAGDWCFSSALLADDIYGNN
jgi:hypothetical protein